MDIQHEIISFDPNSGSIMVRYYTNAYPKGLVFNIDLHAVDGQYPSYDAILDLINHMAPKGQLERAAAIAAAPVPYYLESYMPLVEAPISATPPIIEGTDPLPSA
jgi:hypothetical protein